MANITDEQRKEALGYFKERLIEADESFSINHKNAKADSEYILSLETRSRVLRAALSALEPKAGNLDIICPFCGEGNFDKEGLKGHLVHQDCDEYARVEVEPRMFR